MYGQVCEGDTVSITPEEANEPLYIARVVSMWEQGGEKLFHAAWLNRGGETVLGETSDPCELFLVDMCGDTQLDAVMGKVGVQRMIHSSDWTMLGGKDQEEEKMEEDGTSFFFQKWYDQDTARFEDPPSDYLQTASRVCPSCTRNKKKVSAMIAVPSL